MGPLLLAATLVAPQDLERAADLFERACDHADPVACYLLAGLKERGVGGRGGPKVALSLYKRACAASFQPACREEARLMKGARSLVDDSRCTTKR